VKFLRCQIRKTVFLATPSEQDKQTMKRLNALFQLVADNAGHGEKHRIEVANGKATIFVYDVIGGDFGGVDERQFAKDIASVTSSTIDLRVNSPGGDVFAARAMMTALATSPAKVTAYIDGIAASAATSLLMAADKVVMTRGAKMMIHEAWTAAVGNKGDFAAQSQLLASVDTEIARDYAKRTGKSEADFAAMMEAETWFDADQAKAIGFVDQIIEPTQTASNKWNLSAFKNVPAELIADDSTKRLNAKRRLAWSRPG
jgi:ATP-dependent protease ClpP protease subunit